MNITFRSDVLLLWGDIHSIDRMISIIKYKPNIDNQTILQLGDGLALGFSTKLNDETRLRILNEECIKRNILLYAIRGNHEAKIFWESNYCFSNLFLVPDYSSAQFPNGKTALLVGGGVSIDRFYRKQNIDYWPDEVTIYQKIDRNYDYLLAHDAPDWFNHSTESVKHSPYAQLLIDDPKLFEDCLNQRYVMGSIVKDIYDFKPLYVFSGHYHNSISEEKNGVKYRCLDIEEMLELDSTK